ncbi:uncharacterized protein LOC128202589 [Galleria mellonella]|uniref:Uncharacterized protein LOC128202589 n=1 Tax=Galleria mellonella TaxID=7137 RepID=A0ABM3N725_GALME|nr:uncharacterized protein LOC128202589 [Galleria mellonella]
MWLSTRINCYNILIGTAYRPQWMNIDNFLDAITETVTYFSNYDYTVFMGDLNVNMLNLHNNNAQKIVEFLHYTSLTQIVTEPTHLSTDTETLIDLVCTNAPVRSISNNFIRGSLGHAMINFELTIKKCKMPIKYFIHRPIRDINLEYFNLHLNSINWEYINSLACVDLMVDTFNSMLLFLFDGHAPEKRIKINGKHSLPWVTDTIRRMIDLRNKALLMYRRTGLEVHNKYYKDLKNLVHSSIDREKRAYYNYHINSQQSNGKIFWKKLKENIPVDSPKSDILPSFFNNPDNINAHFLNVPGPNNVSLSKLTYYEFHRYGTAGFRLQPVSESDVARYISAIKSNALGSDRVSRDMILLTLPRTLAIITNIINKSIVTSKVPSQWKHALVTPLSKINNPAEFNDLRPISILSFLSKVLEKAVHTQLLKYVETNNILPKYQSGFRKGKSTTTALLDVVDNILASQDVGNGTILTLLDYSRAFDCLNVPLLLSKLTYYGLDRHSVGWFHSYLSNRYQSVKIQKLDGSYSVSEPKLVDRGVPQGSILGPLLFIIYCADIENAINYCNFHCYADDIQIYISGAPAAITDAAHKLNKDLEKIAAWSQENALVINPNKTKYMILGSTKQITDIINKNITVNILDQSIERVEEARNLGIIFDSRLRFESTQNCDIYWQLPLPSNKMLEQHPATI